MNVKKKDGEYNTIHGMSMMLYVKNKIKTFTNRYLQITIIIVQNSLDMNTFTMIIHNIYSTLYERKNKNKTKTEK